MHLPFIEIGDAPSTARLPFSSLETKLLPDSVWCPSEIEHKTSETTHTSETEPRH
jgi:hypothetical protein